MKASIKQQAINTFIKFLKHEKPQQALRDQIRHTSSALPKIQNIDSPYSASFVDAKQSISQRNDIVFITSRFRSGSTLLWNLFRQTPSCTSYYEPFNERQWFNEALRGDGVDDTHRGVDDYSSEYNGLGFLSDLYNEDWIRDKLLMTGDSWEPEMQSYIEKLAEHAKGRPVLQFNRIDFRLPWLKAHFPNAKLIHLYRHPRDQWCSFLTDKELMNKNDVSQTYSDAFYLDVWCKDLAQHYPVLDKRHTPHPYQRFYYLWKLSYLHGIKHADHNVSFEALTQQPKSEIEKLFTLLKLDGGNVDQLCEVIQAPKADQWKSYADDGWFNEHEAECEYNLSKLLSTQSKHGPQA